MSKRPADSDSIPPAKNAYQNFIPPAKKARVNPELEAMRNISNAYNNILTQCPKQPALPLHPEEVDIMERHGNESGIYIRSSDERLVIAEVYKPGWATHLKTRSGCYTGAPTYVKYFIPIDNQQYGKLVEHLFKLITLEYRCYKNKMTELRKMSFTIIVKLFEQICKYTAEQIECEIKRISNEIDMVTKKVQAAKFEPLMPEILAAIPEEYRAWKGWDASNAVKIKSKCVKAFGLDPEKTQKDYVLRTASQLAQSVLQLFYSDKTVQERGVDKWIGDKNDSHNQLLETFFEDKQTVKGAGDTWGYDSYKYRFKSMEQLEYNRDQGEWHIENLQKMAEHNSNEVHIKFKLAMKHVFPQPIKIESGVDEGKLIIYEPSDNKESLAWIETLLPRCGTRNGGTEWFKKTDGLLDWFEKHGVKHLLTKHQRTKRGDRSRKEQTWALDESMGLEYASMCYQSMGGYMRLTPEQEAKRTHLFDDLRFSCQ